MTSKERPMIVPDQSQPVWRKSSYSSTEGNCVEVAVSAAAVGVRDSKNVAGPLLAFPVGAWRGFLAADLG
jgi:hypothetical protein